jgi:hypothetical protein
MRIENDSMGMSSDQRSKLLSPRNNQNVINENETLDPKGVTREMLRHQEIFRVRH